MKRLLGRRVTQFDSNFKSCLVDGINKTTEEAFAIIKVRYDGGLDHSNSSGVMKNDQIPDTY